jgi:hypothetical protein
MNRKVVAAAIGLLVAAFLVWFFAIRDSGSGGAGGGEAGRGAGFATGKGPVVKKAPGDVVSDGQGTPTGWDVDPVGTLRVEGQVLDDQDAPVEGAEVWLSSQPTRKTTSGEDGSYTFDKVVARQYMVSARAGDLVGGPVSATVREPAIIRLRKGATLTVHVVDEVGTGIAGATVDLRSDEAQRATTNAEGIAELRGVPSGWAQAIATAPGYAASLGGTLITGANTASQLTLIMRKGAAVSGRVVDTAGTPVAGAYVTRHDTGRVWMTGNLEKEAVQTTKTGEFTFDAVPAGTFRFVARDGELAPGSSQPVTVDGSTETKGVEIVMKPGGVVAGIVVDKSGQPAAFAAVQIAPKDVTEFQNWGGMRKATADDKGRFEVKALPREAVRVRAESEVAASAVVEADLTTTERAEVKLVLDVSGTIAGVVVDSQNQPVPEVQVAAIKDFWGGDNQDFALTGFSSATTDGGGAFVLRGLADGEYQLSAHRSGMSLDEGWGQKGTQAKTGDTNVRLVLPSPGSIKGTLVLADGSAPRLATVSVSWNKSTPALDGKFELGDIQPGKYDLVVRGPEFAEKSVRDLEVVEAKATDAGAIKLARGRRLVGSVVDASGNAVAGVHVRVGKMIFTEGSKPANDDPNIDQMMGHRVAITGTDGRFSIVGIPKDQASVVAEHATIGRSDAVKLPEGAQDPPEMKLVLHGFGSIAGTVTLKGQPLQALVMATPKTGGAQIVTVQSGTDGAYVIEKVSEGTHRLTAMKMGVASMSSSDSVDVKVVAGQQVKMDIQIPVGDLTLAIEIKPKAGARVDAAQVFLFRGVVAAKNAKDLMDAFTAGGPSASGMKFWMGTGNVEFAEQLPGRVSVCSIPITGDMRDPQFLQRLQAKSEHLAVYCMSKDLPASPKQQSYTQELPTMPPLPPDEDSEKPGS